MAQSARHKILLERYNKGERMTRLELEELGKLPTVKASHSNGTKFAINKASLAKELGVTGAQISRFLKMDGNPARTTNGYPIGEWRDWYAANRNTNGGGNVRNVAALTKPLSEPAETPSDKKIRLEIKRLENEMEHDDFKRELERGKWMLKTEHDKQLGLFSAGIRNVFERRIVHIAPSEIAEKTGGEGAKITAILRRHFEEIARFISSGGKSEAK